jgi:hypothetical protein
VKENEMSRACGLMGKKRIVCRILVGKTDLRDHSEDQDIGGGNY